MIVVELTPEEALGLELAGNAPNEGIEFQIELVLFARGGMTVETVQFMARSLAAAARSARTKIREATRYEIKVVSQDEPTEEPAP